MAGQIHKTLNEIIKKVSNGNPIIETNTKTKLILRGLDPDSFDENSEDDQVVLDKVNQVAKEFNVQV
mgnify:CR=1 FL=1